MSERERERERWREREGESQKKTKGYITRLIYMSMLRECVTSAGS